MSQNKKRIIYEKKWLQLLISSFVFVCCIIGCKKDAAALVPIASDNLQVGLRRSSDLVATSDGYMRVFQKNKIVGIEYYDNQFKIKSRKTIPMEMEYWGGFFSGSDSYYLVEGNSNKAENDSAEVIRIIRYDKNWKKTGVSSITSNPKLFGGEVRYPFDYGCVEMAEQNGKLYIVTGHEGYVDEAVGQGHQGYLMIEVDLASMKGKIVDCDLWHSFAQYIKADNSWLYVLEQSEGSRYTKLSRYNTATMKKTSLNIFSYGGNHTSAWAIACYASVDGMAVAANNVLCIGTSIDQTKYDSVTSDTPHNIYLTVTPKYNFTEEATTVKQLTKYTGGGKSFLGVKLTKINDNRFMVSWEEYQTGRKASDNDGLSGSILHYLFLDGSGNIVSKEMTKAAPISDCQPVEKNGKVVYYASNSGMVDFYSIDTATGALSQKNYQVAGENATWNFKNGILTISGQGAMSFDKKDNLRVPVSSTSGWYSGNYSTPWDSVKDRVKKVVIQTGITSIPESAFAYFTNLKEIEIGTGVKSIGKEAFAYSSSIEKISIPASVTQIGEDIIWTGYYWVGSGTHVYHATIYAPYGSAAITYAKKNNIYYAMDISKATVTGVEKSYNYNGKAFTPVPTVKMGKEKLKKDTDFRISYQNNKKVGTATVTITGVGRFYGTCTVKFKIAKKQQAAVKSFSDAWNVYTVTKEKSTVAVKKSKAKNPASIYIPATVKYKGIKYKVTSISDNAFKNCKKVKKVTISGNITSIGVSAFQGCSGLTTLKIGAKVTSIGAKAFYDCKNLTAVTIQTQKLTTAKTGKNAFSNVGTNQYKKLKVKVPKPKLSVYKKLLTNKGLSSKIKIVG